MLSQKQPSVVHVYVKSQLLFLECNIFLSCISDGCLLSVSCIVSFKLILIFGCASVSDHSVKVNIVVSD